MNINNPKDLLPQQPPILMLDRVCDIEPGKSGVGERVFKTGDPCFDGHFENDPVLPGVLMIEAVAQTAMAVLAVDSLSEDQRSEGAKPSGFLAKVNQAAFYRPIVPGQTIRFPIEVTRRVQKFFMIDGEVLHEGERCAKVSLTLAMGDPSTGGSS